MGYSVLCYLNKKMCVYIYIYTYSHTYIYIYMYIYIGIWIEPPVGGGIARFPQCFEHAEPLSRQVGTAANGASGLRIA